MQPQHGLLLLAHLAALYIFFISFFPSSIAPPSKLQAFAQQTDDAASNNTAPVQKIVWVVIDALRADLVFQHKQYMPFVNQLLSSGKAYGFRAYAHPPTVTLPRLKALTTGQMPAFLDVLTNVLAEGSASNTDNYSDSLLLRMKQAGKRIVFYGDRTWLHLFHPQEAYFEPRSEGVSSLFVVDTVEVDNNVTRHLDYEIQNQHSWDVLILHYLGLYVFLFKV